MVARLQVVGLGREAKTWVRSYAVDWVGEKNRKTKEKQDFSVKTARE